MLLTSQSTGGSSGFDPNKVVIAKYTYVFPTPPANQYNPPQFPGPAVPLVVVGNDGNIVMAV